MFWPIACLLSFVVGVFGGAFIMSILATAKRADELAVPLRPYPLE